MMELQLIKSREQNGVLTENLTHLEFKNKKLDMLAEDL